MHQMSSLYTTEVEYKFFTVISIDSLLAYDNNYYLEVYLDNWAYEVVDNQW